MQVFFEIKKGYNKNMQLIEAVPNISEGKNNETIAHVVSAAGSLPGARVLHVDSNPDANRTVITLAGEPNAVIKNTFELIIL